MRFSAPRPLFGKRSQVENPAGIVKTTANRAAQLVEAADVLAVLPGEGETLHCLQTGRWDTMTMIVVLIEKVGPCSEVRLATLSFNRNNLAAMLDLMDTKQAGRLTLLCSAVFVCREKELWAETLAEFRNRGQRAAAARSHCKTATLACTDGRRFSMFGSANLRQNGCTERFALANDAAIHDYDAAWIDAMVTQHEGDADE